MLAEAKEEREAVTCPGSARELAEAVRGPLRRYGLRGDQVEVLPRPEDYHQAIVQGIQGAQSRILIAVLDIASGEKEMGLLQLLEEACGDRPGIRVCVLVDLCRMMGPGGFQRSRQRLDELAIKYPRQMRVWYYEHPKTTHWSTKCLPYGLRSVSGVSHMKALVFDDTLLLTGANLRGEYFTQRQDRALRFHQAAPLCNAYDRIITTLGRYSHTPSARRPHRRWPLRIPPLPCRRRLSEGEEALRAQLMHILTTSPTEDGEGEDRGASAGSKGPAATTSGADGSSGGVDTWVVLDLQLPSLDIHEDHRLCQRVYDALPCGHGHGGGHGGRGGDGGGEADGGGGHGGGRGGGGDGCHVRLSTGYCNPADVIVEGLRRHARAGQVELLVPCTRSSSVSIAGGSRQGQRWYERWVSKMYEAVESLVRERIAGQTGKVRLLEYEEDGHSFHAKGMWITYRHHKHDDGSEAPVDVSVVGSSNFDRRGFERDLESEAWIFTDDAGGLGRRLQAEWSSLASRAREVEEEEWRERRRRLTWTLEGCCVVGLLCLAGSHL